jgi:Cu/Ag efflux protein CusF
MKKIALALAALLVAAGMGYAAQSTAPAKKAKPMSATKTHVVAAEVVSSDATAKTLTLKTEQGEMTSKVEGAAVASLKNLKAGEKVKVTCRDNEAGEHEAITHITVEKAPKK